MPDEDPDFSQIDIERSLDWLQREQFEDDAGVTSELQQIVDQLRDEFAQALATWQERQRQPCRWLLRL